MIIATLSSSRCVRARILAVQKTRRKNGTALPSSLVAFTDISRYTWQTYKRESNKYLKQTRYVAPYPSNSCGELHEWAHANLQFTFCTAMIWELFPIHDAAFPMTHIRAMEKRHFQLSISTMLLQRMIQLFLARQAVEPRFARTSSMWNCLPASFSVPGAKVCKVYYCIHLHEAVFERQK